MLAGSGDSNESIVHRLGRWLPSELGRLGRGLRASFGNFDTWLLIGAVGTPILLAVAMFLRDSGSSFERWSGAFVVALALSATVVADCLLAVRYSVPRLTFLRGVGAVAIGGLVVAGLWLCWFEVEQDTMKVDQPWIVFLFGAAAIALVMGVTPEAVPTSRTEMLRGALTLGAALLGLLSIVVALATAWPADHLLRICGVVVPVLVALWAAGVEWSRRWLLGASLVAVAGVAAVVIAIGYDDLRAAPKERITAAREAVAELEQRQADRTEELREQLRDAVAPLDARVTRAQNEEPPPDPTQQPAPKSTRLLALEAARDTLASAATAAGPTPPATSPANNADNESSLAADLAKAAGAVDALAAEALTDGETGWWTAVVAEARAATAALSALVAYDPTADDVNRAIGEARECAQEADTEPDRCSTSVAKEVIFADALASMDLELARYRAAITGEQVDVDAVAAIENDMGAQDGAVEPITFVDALQRGPEVLSGAVNGKREQPLVPGPLGWAFFGLVALGLWSWLLRTNAKQLAGPVHIERVLGVAADPDGGGAAPAAGADEEGEAKDEPKTDADSTLRIAVLQNLREPGTVPGADALEPVTNLVAIPGVDPGWIAKLVKALGDLIGKPYGYGVTVEVIEDPEREKNMRFRALARVKDRRNGSTLGTRVIEEPTLNGAVRAAGLWASGFILDRSTRIPSWVAWNADTAKALSTANENKPDLAALEAAATSAPNSGLLLYLLGGEYETHGRGLDALMAISRAVASHPRYAIARYRLAASLSMMGAHRPNIFAYTRDDERESTLGMLELAVDRIRLRGGRHQDALDAIRKLRKLKDPRPRPQVGTAEPKDRPPESHAAWARYYLLKLSTALCNDMEARTLYLPVAASALRRSERDQTFHLLSPFASGRRRRLARHDLAQSLRLIHEDETNYERLVFLANAEKAATSWQVTYNAACAKTIDLDYDQAISMLEACLVKENVHQLDGSWLNEDPDLARLREDPRFARLARRFGDDD